MQTLHERFLAERVRTVDNKLNEASDEETLREINPKIKRLQKVAQNLESIITVKNIIDDAKAEALKYVSGGRWGRATSRSAIKKIDKLTAGITNLMSFVRQLGNVAPDLEDGDEYSGKMATMISKGLGRMEGDFLQTDVKEELNTVLMHLTPKQLQTFGARKLTLTSAQQNAINGQHPDSSEDTEGTEGAEDTEGTEGAEDTEGTEGAEGAEGTEGAEGAEGAEEMKGSERLAGPHSTPEERAKIIRPILQVVDKWKKGEGDASNLARNMLNIIAGRQQQKAQ